MVEVTVKEVGNSEGFTLIYLSIVLVVIGLVGLDLIRAAYVRAQVTRIQSHDTAVNPFYGNYQALPGNLNAQVAQANGFTARYSFEGEGDGNGISKDQHGAESDITGL